MANEIVVSGKSYKGISYTEYMDRTKIKLLSTNLNSLTEEEMKLFYYTKLNLQRSIRIEKNYIVSDNLKTLLSSINQEQSWLVLTEDWCGDSAQNLPYINKITECNAKVKLCILLRDSNPELMDEYLTNGSRSIPKLIAFDTKGTEIFKWGPRPKAAQELFMNLKKQDMPKPEIYENLHMWYTQNHGKELEKEFTELLQIIIAKYL
jgi:hypothetical protein